MARGSFSIIAGVSIVSLLLFFFYTASFVNEPIVSSEYEEPHTTITCPPPEKVVYVERKPCLWNFIKYVASPWEETWVSHAKEWGSAPCQRYFLDGNKEKAEYWYKWSHDSQNLPPASPPDTAIFSYAEWKNCKGEEVKIYMEPLALLARNPLFCNGGDVVDKSYLAVDWSMAEQVRDSGNGQVYLFDLGASTYNQGAGGASQSWFVEKLEQRGLNISGIWAWEVTFHQPKDVFADIPNRLWPVYHWYNIPAETGKDHGGNPLNMIRQITTPKDMVILKIDIDSPKIETEFITQILADPHLAGLIDVMFFEDHINAVEMAPYFGSVPDTLKDLMDSFTALRKAGIRAHPWV